MTRTSSRQRRIFDVLTTSLLLVSAAIVLFAATPALLRLAGIGPSRSARPILLPARTHRVDSDPGPIVIEEGDDDDDDDHPSERAPDRSPHAGIPGVIHLGQAKVPVYLHDMPEGESPLAGRLKVGELVAVIREENGWLRVKSLQSDGEPQYGWAKKGEILIR